MFVANQAQSGFGPCFNIMAPPRPICDLQCMASTQTCADRARGRHDMMQARGIGPVQILVLDLRAPGFAAECVCQAQPIRMAETPGNQADDEAWFKISDTTGGAAQGAATW